MSLGFAGRPVSMAVRTKTWPPQTIGVEAPLPGMAVFHLMFVRSSHFTGGSPFGAMPVASGPRHWCQLSRRSSAWARAPARHSASVNRAILGMVRSVVSWLLRGWLEAERPHVGAKLFQGLLGLVGL